MNRLDDLFKDIESHEFSAIVNLASDFKTFVRILAAQQPVQDLAAVMGDAAVRAAVSDRILVLAGEAGEEGYEHPSDSALAAYLWLLIGADAGRAEIAGAKVAPLPRCWWARQMAQLAVERASGKPAEKAPRSDRIDERSEPFTPSDPSLSAVTGSEMPESKG